MVVKSKYLFSWSLLLAVLFLSGTLFADDIRIWRNEQGAQFEGRFVRVLLGKVMLETKEGKKLYIPLKELSKWDQKYLASIFVPKVNIRFSDSSRSKFRSKNALADDVIRIVSGDAIITTKNKIESTTLRVEAYMIGKEVATDDYKLLEKGSMPLNFNKENEYTCTFHLETESRKYVEYNRQIRGCLYIGYVVIVLDRNDKVVDFRSNLRWITKDNLGILRKFEKDDFFDGNLKSRPVPRPKNTGLDRVGVQ